MAERRTALVFVPLVVVGVLAGLFVVMLTADRNAAEVPSVLIGKTMPQTPLPALPDKAAFPARIAGPALVNVFASWCAPCRAEHPVLTALAREMPVHGIAHKDAREASAKFLAELGDPYTSVGMDPKGRASIEWGVTGVPETFLIDADGIVRHVVRGPIDAAAYDRLIKRIAELKAS